MLETPESARNAQRREETMVPKKTATKAKTALAMEVGGPSGLSKIPKTLMNTITIIPSPAASDASERSEARNPRRKRLEVAQEQPVLIVPQPQEVPLEPKEKGDPSDAPGIVMQEGGRVSMTLLELLGVIQTALVCERLI